MTIRECLPRLTAIGISPADAEAIRRIAMTLHRWHELECGTSEGAIERDEVTGKTYFRGAMNDRRWSVPDNETAALYILRPDDVRGEGSSMESCYTNGIAVYK